ncbi:hypothetical protein H0A73_16810 [Alcaligenaceae bacterium]|nr:hypothetical protein [Alcaligenaceae bacterium]
MDILGQHWPIGSPFSFKVRWLCEDGSSPYKTWFDGLDSLAAAKVTTAKLRLGFGHISRVKWFDGIGEYVIDRGPGYRIYLALSESSVTRHLPARCSTKQPRYS